MSVSTRYDNMVASPPDDLERGSLVPTKKSPAEINETRPKREYLPIKDFLNNIADHAMTLGNNSANKDRRRKIAKMRSMYEGDMVLRWDDEKQTWINKKKAGDALYIDPVLATFIDIITAQLAKSRSTLVVKARSEEKIDKQQAASYATEIVKDASTSLLNARNTQREIKYGFLLSGEAFRFTYFDKSVEGRGINKPKHGVKVTKATPEAWYCPECNAHGMAQDLNPVENPDVLPDAPAPEPDGDGREMLNEVVDAGELAGPTKDRCPTCDFPQVQKIGGRGFNIAIDEGSEYENIGDVNTEFPDSLEMTVVGARDHISDALVVIRDRMMPRCVLESIYDHKDLPSTGTPDNLKYKGLGDNGTTNDTQTYSGNEAFEMLHFQEVWVNPTVYHGYQSPRDEELPSGDKITKGDTVPGCEKGAYFARVGKVIVDIYPQAIKDCWTHAVHSITSNFHGQGEWDLMPLQEQKNELRSMQVNAVLMDSLRPLMKRNGAFTGAIPNKAGAIITINNLAEDKPMGGYAIDRVPGGGADPLLFSGLDDKLAGGMQQRAGAFSSTTDLPDAKLLGTATGVATLAEHAIGRRAPMLALRAEMEKEQAYQYLECRQNYWPEQMYESLDRKVSADAGRFFREADIRRDFIVEVVPDSFLPQTAAQDATNFNQMMQVLMPLAQGDPTIAKQIKARAVELFGRGFDLDNYALEKMEAAVRLSRLKQIAEVFENESGIPVIDQNGQAVPEMVMAVFTETTKAIKMAHVSSTADNVMNPEGMQPDQFQSIPVDPLLDQHSEYMEIYGDWLKSSEGRDASLFLRTCIRTLIEKHRDAQIQRVISEKTDEQMTMIPEIQSQLLQNQVMSEQQSELGAKQADEQFQQQTAQKDEAVAQDAKHQLIGRQLGLVE